MGTKFTSIVRAVALEAISSACWLICRRKRVAVLIGVAVAVLTLLAIYGTAVAECVSEDC